MAAPKQTLPTTDALEAALEALETARAAFEVACYDFREALDLSPLTTALAAWRTAADHVNELAYDASADLEMYCGERSERWLESARGKAVEAWKRDLDDMQLSLDPDETVTLDIDLSGETPTVAFVNDPDEVLPTTPECPGLDEYA